MTPQNAAIGLNLASIIANGNNQQQGKPSSPLADLMAVAPTIAQGMGLNQGANAAIPTNADAQPTDAFQNNTAYLGNQASNATPLAGTTPMQGNQMLQKLLAYRMNNGGLF